jgi:organic radical activating enzyme
MGRVFAMSLSNVDSDHGEGRQGESQAPLSGFIAPLQSALRGYLRTLFGLPAAVDLRWRSLKYLGSQGLLDIIVGDDNPLAFRVELPGTQGTPWFRGSRLWINLSGRGSYSYTEKALLKTLHRRLRAWEKQSGGEFFDKVRESIDLNLRFDEVKDWMYYHSSPTESQIRLGFRCNQDCGFCWQSRTWPEPPVEYYYRWIDEFAALGRTTLTFSGGEPTIHRELPRLIEYASKKRGFEVWLQTNAIRFAKREFVEELVDAGLDLAFISFHSHLHEVSDSMTRAPRTHKKTVAGIERALESNVSIMLNCVVERRNFLTLGAHAQYIIDNFVNRFPRDLIKQVIYSHPNEYHTIEEWRENVVALDELSPHLGEALNKLLQEKVPVQAIGTCGFPPCILKDFPQLHRKLNCSELATEDTSGRFLVSACSNCSAKSTCLGVRKEYVSVYGERGITPFA